MKSPFDFPVFLSIFEKDFKFATIFKAFSISFALSSGHGEIEFDFWTLIPEEEEEKEEEEDDDDEGEEEEDKDEEGK